MIIYNQYATRPLPVVGDLYQIMARENTKTATRRSRLCVLIATDMFLLDVKKGNTTDTFDAQTEEF